MIETFVGRTDNTRALYKSSGLVIDTTTTQMTSPSAEGPSLASHRMPSRLRLSSKCRRAQARF